MELDVEELVLELVLELELVLDEVDVLVAPKLLEEMVPLDVEVELPPVEVELPPVEVELPPVEVELPPLEVEVEPAEVDTVIVVLPPVELPPKKPPLKKPPPKPKPPVLPPMTIGTPPPLVLATATGGGGGGGTNIGGMMVRVVTVGGGAGQATRRTVRRTTRRGCAARRAGLAFAWLMTEGRGGGFSATWTAPPPMIAPPAVQAHSFAKAILTDITSILFLIGRTVIGVVPMTAGRCGHKEQMQTIGISATALTIFAPSNG